MPTSAKAKRTIELTFLRHQPEVFDARARHVVYVKGRRAGGTRGAAHRLVELAHERRGSRHLWVDTTRRNIERVVRRYFLPAVAGSRARWDATRQILAFEGGAYCDFGSMHEAEHLEGFAYDYVWVNEAGHVLRNEQLYYETLLPMLLERDSAQAFFIGAPKGPGLFQRMYEWGQDAERSDWQSFRHTAHENPLVDPAAVERLRMQMPERTFRQEVLAEFVAGDAAVFRDVRRAATAAEEPAPAGGAPYVLGVDLARYHDYSAVWVGRADSGAAVYCERYHRRPWPAQVQRIAALAERYGGASAHVDATGVGDPVCDALRAAGVAVEPVVLTAGRKRQLVEALALALEQQHLVLVPHEPTLAELEAYAYETLPSGQVRMGAPPGGHDDCVIALALCWWGMGARDNEWILGPKLESSEHDP